VFQHVAQVNPQHKNDDFGIFYLKWGALTRYNVLKHFDFLVFSSMFFFFSFGVLLVVVVKCSKKYNLYFRTIKN
jgi:hypothetical protein